MMVEETDLHDDLSNVIRFGHNGQPHGGVLRPGANNGSSLLKVRLRPYHLHQNTRYNVLRGSRAVQVMPSK